MKRKNLLLLFTSLFLNSILLAQHSKEAMNTLSYAELDSLVYIEYSKGAYKSAIPYLEHGMERAKEEFGEEDSTYADYLGNLAYFYFQVNKYQEVEVLYLKAKEIRKKLFGESHPNYASALNNLAFLYQKLGNYEQAEPLYLQALNIKKETLGEKHPDYALSLNNMAYFYDAIGKYEQADLLYTEALGVYKHVYGEEHLKYAVPLDNLATLYIKMKKNKEAEVLFLKAKKIKQAALGELHPDYSRTLNNLATLYFKTKRYKDAEVLYKQAIEIRKKTLSDQHPRYATSVSNLAVLYREMGHYEKAETLFMEALQVRKQAYGESHPDYTTTLNNLAALFRLKNQLNKAFAYSMTGIAANSESFSSIFPTLFSQSSSNNSFSPDRCCNELKPTDFLKLSHLKYRNAVRMNESFRTLLEITKAKFNTKGLENSQAQVALQQHYYINKAAMKFNENLRNDFSSKSNKLLALKDNNVFVEFGINTALEMNQTSFYEEAFSFAELNKSVLLTDALKGNRARVLGDLPDSISLYEIDLQQQKDELKKSKYQVKNDAEKAEIISKENKLNQEIDLFLKSLKTKYPKYHRLKYENINAKAADVQQLLDKETMLIEYFVVDTMTYLFAVTNKKVELFKIDINKKELKKKIKTLRNVLSDYIFITQQKPKAYQVYTETAFWFYNNMLSIATKDKKVKNLIIVTDGELGHLPFETFLIEQAPQGGNNYKDLHYLMLDYNISYNYSATLFVNSQRNLDDKRNHPANNKQILACAAAYPKIDSTLLNLRMPHVFKTRSLLNPLPEAQNEVRILSENLQGDFLQNEACNEAFFKENAHKYGVIHLAMHGLLQPRAAMLSSLAFTENRDSLEDNFLQAYEISRLNLNADLVVLSACETGYGQFEQGEGVLSLARSFMYAGVPSLVVSLWQVNDGSTAFIMQNFYRYLAKGIAKDVALRQAKLDYIQSAEGVAAHPAFWSPFIQLGDSHPIKLASRGGWMSWLIGGTILLLILGGLFFRNKPATH